MKKLAVTAFTVDAHQSTHRNTYQRAAYEIYRVEVNMNTILSRYKSKIIDCSFNAIIGFFCFVLSSYVGAECSRSTVGFYSGLDELYRYNPQPPNPTDGNVIQKLQFTAIQNEQLSFNFRIKVNGACDRKLSVEVQDLNGDGSIIKSSKFNVRYLLYWLQAPGAWETHAKKPAGEDILVPELLVKDPNLVRVDATTKQNKLKIIQGGKEIYLPVRITASTLEMATPKLSDLPIKDSPTLLPFQAVDGSTQHMWIDLPIDDLIEASQYSGKVRIVDEQGVEINSLPLEIKVIPIKLAKSPLVHSIYYRGKLVLPEDATVSSEFKNETQLRREFDDMRSHGINNPVVYQPTTANKWLPDNSRSSAKNLFQKYMQIRNEFAFDKSSLYLASSITDPNALLDPKQIYIKDIALQKSEMSTLGYNNIYHYGIDEAEGNKIIQQFSLWQQIQQRGIKIFAAGTSELINKASDKVDVVVYNGQPSNFDINTVHKYGKKILLYSKPQSGVENPYLYRYRRGIYLWQHNLDGAMDYAYQHSMGSIWYDNDHKIYRDHVFAYPTVDGVIDTAAWEGYREGIQDLRLIYTLEAQIQNTKLSTAQRTLLEQTINDIRGMTKPNYYELKSTIYHALEQTSPPNPPVMNINP